MENTLGAPAQEKSPPGKSLPGVGLGPPEVYFFKTGIRFQNILTGENTLGASSSIKETTSCPHPEDVKFSPLYVADPRADGTTCGTREKLISSRKKIPI